MFCAPRQILLESKRRIQFFLFKVYFAPFSSNNLREGEAQEMQTYVSRGMIWDTCTTIISRSPSSQVKVWMMIMT